MSSSSLAGSGPGGSSIERPRALEGLAGGRGLFPRGRPGGAVGRRKIAYRMKLIELKFEPDRRTVGDGVNIEQGAAKRELAGFRDEVTAFIAQAGEYLDEVFSWILQGSIKYWNLGSLFLVQKNIHTEIL